MTPAQKRQRAAILEVIRGSIDEARFAIKAGNIEAHDVAMESALNFLNAYAGLPAIVVAEDVEIEAEAEAEAALDEVIEAAEESATATGGKRNRS